MRGMGVKGGGLKSTSWDVKYRIGNVVNSIIIIMCGVSWVLDLPGCLLSKLHNA